MTIATMEALEALSPGTTVRVSAPRLGHRIYVRNQGGFETDGVTVEPRFFEGHIAAGQVALFGTGDPEAGDHYVQGRHQYVILSVDADQQATIMQFHNNQYQSMIGRPVAECRNFTWTRVHPDQRPDWHQTALTVGAQMRAVQIESQRMQDQLTQVRRELDAAQLNLTRMREARAAQIQVVATGVSRLPIEKAAGQVPDKVTVVDVVASWRREFTVTTEPVAGCQCGTISRERVIELLGIDGSSDHADFGFQVDCGRH